MENADGIAGTGKHMRQRFQRVALVQGNSGLRHDIESHFQLLAQGSRRVDAPLVGAPLIAV